MVGVSFGTLAVNAFFIISGFLVTGSLFHNNQNIFKFFRARLLRIYPALIIALLFTAFVVGVLFTTLPKVDYLTQKATYSFVVRDLFLIDVFHFRYDLPGVFKNLPYPEAVNGSLWTLPWEIWAYISLGVLGFLPRRALTLLIPIVGVALFLLNGFYPLIFSDDASPFFAIGIRLGSFFYVGSVVYLLRDRIPLSWIFCVLAFVCLILSECFGFFAPVLPVFLSYILFYLAFVPAGKIRSYNALGDYSYGMYIFAYPIQQGLVEWFSIQSPSILTLLTIAITLPLAMLSWRFVEKPALRFKTAQV